MSDTNPEICPCIYGQSLYDKGTQNIQWERTVTSMNVRKTAESHGKE